MDETNRKSKSPRRLLKIGIILGILALLALIAIPNSNHHGHNSPGGRMNVCINNLRQIDAATQQWALENNKTNLDTIVTWSDVKPYLMRSTNNSLDLFRCPEDKTKRCSNSYTLGDLKTRPKCKINPATHLIN